MKYCGKCGKQLDDKAKFCPYCGAKTEDIPPKAAPIPSPEPQPVVPPAAASAPADTAQEVPAKTKKKSSKGKIVVTTILLVLLAAGIGVGVLAFRWYTSTEQQALRALEIGDYDTVLELVEEDLSVVDSQAVAQQLKERIAGIQAGFLDNTIEYASAKMELDSIAELDVTGVADNVDEVEAFIDAVNQSRADFATAESFYDAGDFGEAIGYYQMVIEDDPNYETAVSELAKAVSAYRDAVLSDAAQSAAEGAYSAAIAKLNNALDIIPDDADITEQIRIYEKASAEKQKADALATAESYADSGKYYEALKAIEDAMEEQPNDADLLQAYTTYCAKYVEAVINEADEAMDQNDYDAAAKAVKDALTYFPDSSSLLDKQQEIENRRPIYLEDLEIIASDRYTGNMGDSFIDNIGTRTGDIDIHGNVLAHGLEAWLARWNYIKEISWAWVEYSLDSEYTALTGKLTVLKDSYNTDSFSSVIAFIGDGTVLCSVELTPGMDVQDVFVDLSGISVLRIYVYDTSASKGGTAFGLWDFAIQ